MAELVTMPKLGFDMAEGTLVRWVKAEGDSVQKGDVIAEIETDKATVEVESSDSGVMFRHLVEEATTLPVNAPIAVIAEEGEEPSQDEIDAMVKEAGGEPAGKKAEKKEKPAEKEKKAEEETAEPEKAESEKAPEEVQEEDISSAGGVRSSPLARRMAEEEDID
jgi:pyruvate dehydrogenase E2 component (dihydrolipoamide acetyltransferase)